MTTPILLPPTHVIDAPGVYISPSDPVWDLERGNREIADLKAKGSEEGRAAALARMGHEPATEADLDAIADAAEQAADTAAWTHPVLRYARGETRFQLDAQLVGPSGESCTVRDWMRPGVEPCRFTLVRPSRKKIRAAEAVDNTDDRREAWIRAVVRKIEGPEGRLSWAPAKDNDEVPDAVLEAMFAWFPMLIRQVADACKAYCGPLMAHEGKL